MLYAGGRPRGAALRGGTSGLQFLLARRRTPQTGRSRRGEAIMPYDQVMSKWKRGTLKSGGKTKVKNQKQAVAIMLSEKRKAAAGNTEYARTHKGLSK